MTESTIPNDNQALYLLGFSPQLTQLRTIDASRTKSASIESLDVQTALLLKQLGVESLEAGTVWAWFKRIERCDFEGPVGEKNLADIHWLTPRVIAHETVVAHLSQQSAFYPARFGTLFSTSERLSTYADQASGRLVEFFDRVRGKCEWGMKLYGDTAQAAEIIAQRDGILKEGKPAGGANYLKLRQLQREQSHFRTVFMAEAFETALRSLQSQFQEIVARPLVVQGKDSTREVLLGNLALLANAPDSEHLASWVKDWNSERTLETGVRVELTGPWPAYSFCPSLSAPAMKDAA